MIIPYDQGWPLWGRVAIIVVATVLLGTMVWQYYKHFWRH